MRESGTVIVADPNGAISEAATRQCVHCGRHWIHRPGSRTIRGYCMSCNGPFCGPQCEECVPQEQQIENLEQGLPMDFRPVRVAIRTPRLFP